MAPEELTQATAAGVVAVVVGALGVHPQVLGYALTGAAVGTLAAPAVGRWRAMSLFAAVVAGIPSLGAWLASRITGGKT